MSLFKFKIEKKKLDDIENKLIKEIAQTDNKVLMDLFFDWQNQRNVCNDEFVKYMDEEFKKADKSIN